MVFPQRGRSVRRKRLTADDLKKLRALRDLRRSGWSVDDLCGHFGISRRTYFRWSLELARLESEARGALPVGAVA
jgi:transposase-like protein